MTILIKYTIITYFVLDRIRNFLSGNLTPEDRFNQVIIWRDNVIPIVDQYVKDLENVISKETGHKFTEEEKRLLFENYLGLATEVFCSG